MRRVAYQSGFAQLSDAVGDGWRTDRPNSECRGPSVCHDPGAQRKGVNDVRETMLCLAL